MKIFNFLKPIKKSKFIFFFLGISSAIWFLIRVIPKPSRATYPCMQASAPIMSAFIVYLIGLISTIYIFKKQNRSLLYSRFTLASLFVVLALFSFSSNKEVNQMQLNDASYYQANAPIGIAKGIFPGRVAWVHNPDITNANMANTLSDYWALDKNCNQVLVDSMLSSGIRRIGGKSDVKQAWDGIFKYFNNNRGKGLVGYTKGEKFAIKVNLTNSCCLSLNEMNTDQMDVAPQMVLGILRQLIEVVGVPQSDIWIGDCYRKFRDVYYNKCHTIYPNVHYVDGQGLSGREKTVPSSTQLLKFSDGLETSSIPQHYIDAAYFINMPCLKSHDAGGITIAAKNHQGSILSYKSDNGNTPQTQSAYYMHYALPGGSIGNSGTKQYRHLVDYMGHEELGGKTLIFIVDGLWAGKNWDGVLEKWKMAPFNTDYPSSLFMSQDAVAIESVCFDFLLQEYASKSADEKYPYMSGADDYLFQAADPANWPVNISYDPEGDGTILKSLGVYEHWNNPTDKQYSRNLGTGNGIELMLYTSLATDNYTDEVSVGVSLKELGTVCRIYPNPSSDYFNVEVGGNKDISMKVYEIQGKLVFNAVINSKYTWHALNANGSKLLAGKYILILSEKTSGKVMLTEKIILN